VNRFDNGGSRFFGYPSCITVGRAGGGVPTMQRADTRVTGALRHDDAWCSMAANNHVPVFGMQGHWAPLGVTEYADGVLPAAWRGDLFVAAHGSWNHSAGVGRLIARLDVQPDGSIATVQVVVAEDNGTGGFRQNQWSMRPVDIRPGPDGAIYFTDDAGGRVFRLGAR